MRNLIFHEKILHENVYIKMHIMSKCSVLSKCYIEIKNLKTRNKCHHGKSHSK